jgi:D-xylose transport system substrate-binding protein
VLLKPIWVTSENLGDTTVKDKFVDAAQLCAGDLADACKAANIAP